MVISYLSEISILILNSLNKILTCRLVELVWLVSLLTSKKAQKRAEKWQVKCENTDAGSIGRGQVITKTTTMTVTVISMGDELMEKEARRPGSSFATCSLRC